MLTLYFVCMYMSVHMYIYAQFFVYNIIFHLNDKKRNTFLI